MNYLELIFCTLTVGLYVYGFYRLIKRARKNVQDQQALQKPKDPIDDIKFLLVLIIFLLLMGSKS